MPFCSNCGQKLENNAKFCYVCGSANKGYTENQSRRKTVFDGEIHKCPQCGEVLSSFSINCPSCGFELRGVKSANSIQEFTSKLENAKTEEQRVLLIRNFPIPNTKEDILEFMILASTNIIGEHQKTISDAWTAKFEQSFKKAQLVFSNDNDFSKIESIYDHTYKQINKEKKLHIANAIKNTISKSANDLPQIALSIGWLISVFVLIPLCGINLDVAGFNIYQMIIILDFIVGAIALPYIINRKSNLSTLITVVGLIISIIVLIPLCGKNLDVAGFNAYQLILFVNLITSIIILVRIFKR